MTEAALLIINIEAGAKAKFCRQQAMRDNAAGSVVVLLEHFGKGGESGVYDRYFIVYTQDGWMLAGEYACHGRQGPGRCSNCIGKKGRLAGEFINIRR